MDTYVILRRGAWPTERSSRRPRHARPRSARRCRTTSAGSAATSWTRAAAGVGTVCIYQASSPEAIREHASKADLAVDEIIKVADTVIVRPDPEPAAA